MLETLGTIHLHPVAALRHTELFPQHEEPPSGPRALVDRCSSHRPLIHTCLLADNIEPPHPMTDLLVRVLGPYEVPTVGLSGAVLPCLPSGVHA